MSDETEAALAFLSLWVGIMQDQQIAAAELVLADTPVHYDGPPLPDTTHPGLTYAADYVRAWDADGRRNPVFIPIVQRPAWFYGTDDWPVVSTSALRKEVLSWRPVFAPAPYVGAPAVYTWRAWSDTHGRHITTHAELVTIP